MQLEIKLVRGLAGAKKNQIEICKSLGLTKTNDVKIHPDNEATRGKIAKVSHLVKVTER